MEYVTPKLMLIGQTSGVVLGSLGTVIPDNFPVDDDTSPGLSETEW